MFASKFWQFLKLTRPLFLLGGMMLYALGALFAYRQGVQLSAGAYLLGQLLVTSIQLMTHYGNEYYDQAGDRLNKHSRTWFSGGSGVLAAGGLQPTVALLASRTMAGMAIALLVVLGLQSPWMLGMGTIALLAAWFYSTPPLSLVGTGWGELSTSLLVAFLVPMVSYTQQTGQFDPALGWICLPLMLVHMAMLIAFEIPDWQTDRQTGKRTLTVRLGLKGAVQIHHLLLILGLMSGVSMAVAGVPAARWVLWILPLAIWQIATLHQYLNCTQPRCQWMTLRAIGLFAGCSLLWVLGITLG